MNVTTIKHREASTSHFGQYAPFLDPGPGQPPSDPSVVHLGLEGSPGKRMVSLANPSLYRDLIVATSLQF
jgi:hypothetical protein